MTLKSAFKFLRNFPLAEVIKYLFRASFMNANFLLPLRSAARANFNFFWVVPWDNGGKWELS